MPDHSEDWQCLGDQRYMPDGHCMCWVADERPCCRCGYDLDLIEVCDSRTSSSPEVPEGMTPERLRTIADWLDTYERLVEAHVNMVEALQKRGLIKHSGNHDEVRRIIAGTEVQDDLRRWADAIEASLSGSPVEGTR